MPCRGKRKDSAICMKHLPKQILPGGEVHEPAGGGGGCAAGGLCQGLFQAGHLKEPEAFPGWLGMIVANEAKNALQKKNPLLFSEVQTQEEDFIPEVEDTREEAQPELSYSRKETQELVREMINALSEEQRVCILMFEIEGIPIKDIAASLGCSE